MNFNSILIGSENPKALTEFYTRVLGKPGFEDSAYTGWQLGNGFISIGAHDEVTGKNPQPGRLIWNIESEDVKADFDRFVAAGATVVREPYNPGGPPEFLIATFSDPDGNYFQLMSPMTEAM
ncbi:MAG: VOC family protein [Candidatus Limnocylindria bacterium]